MIKKYRKKPVVIEAMKWDGSVEMAEFLSDHIDGTIVAGDRYMVFTLEGDMYADKGDYIIKGIKGEFYPCKPDIFKATYEEVEE